MTHTIRMSAVLASLSLLVTLVTIIVLFAGGNAGAAEIRVMTSGGFSAAYRALTPLFEQRNGHQLVTAWGPSMGETPDAIPVRLERGEHADVLIMVGSALEQLVNQGRISCRLRVDLAGSGIGMAVRKGAPKPDISTVDTFSKTLLAASSIAYSDSASGDYLAKVLFKRLGIEKQIKGKSRMIPAEPVGLVVARGEAELGFQQISELLPIPGIDLVGPLPQEIQKTTTFSACITTKTTKPDAAKALVNYLSSPDAAPAIRASGMTPYGK